MPDVFNAGVYTFLGISGFLYGSKTITSWGSWMKRRFAKVMLPAMILSSAVLIGCYAFGERYDAVSVVFNLFQLQGLAFILPGVQNLFVGHHMLGPLWFLTVIMLCYCLVPVLQKIKATVFAEKPLFWTSVAACACFMLCLATRICFFFFLTFAAGYFMGMKQPHIGTKRICVLTIGTLVMQILRLLLRMYADGSHFYQTYTYLSHMVLGLWILCFFLWLSAAVPVLTKQLAESKAVVAVDELSLYVYMTHSIFCNGAMSPYTSTSSLLLATILFILLTLISALLLRKITGAVSSVLP